MFRRLSDSTFAAAGAAGSQTLSFLTSCGRGLMRQTRFQATGFCLAVLGLTMFHVTPASLRRARSQ